MPEPTKPTHRLRSITVQEVSLVDRAANQRRFLLTKREDDMKRKSVTKDETTQATSTGDGAAAATGGGIQQQVKEGLTTALANLADKVLAIANEVDALEVTDQPVEPAVPATVTAQFEEVASMLSEIASKFGGAAAATGDAGSDTGAVTASETDTGTPAPAAKVEDDEKEPTEKEAEAVAAALSETTQKGLDPKTHADVVAKSVAARLSVPLERAQVVVAKVGRRMAKKRLEQLGKAIDMLVSLMKELRYDSEKRRKQEQEQQGQAQVGKTDTTSTEPAVDTASVEALAASAEELIEMAKASDTAAATLRTELAKANARIATLEKSTPVSNTLPVEKSSSGKGVVWSLDMNAKKPAAR